MKKLIPTLLLLLPLVCVMPAVAQSKIDPIPGIYIININGKIYEAPGSVLNMEFSNLSEKFSSLTLEIDDVPLAKQLEVTWEKVQELEWKPVELNSTTSKSTQKVSWDRKAGSITINTDDDVVVLEVDDGDVRVTIVFTDEGPVIMRGESGENL